MSDFDKAASPAAGHYRRLFEEAPLAYQSLDQDGCLQDVNLAWLRLLGYDRSEVIGRPLRDFLPLSFHPQFDNSWRSLQDGHGAQCKILEMVRGNGTRITVEVSTQSEPSRGADPAICYCLLRDITDQSNAEREDRRLSRRLDMVLATAPGAIVGFDQDGLVTFANPAAEDLIGWPAADLIGVHLHERLHGCSSDGAPTPPGTGPGCECLTTRQRASGETYLCRRDGSCFPVSYTASPYFESGAYVGGVVSFEDITEQHTAQIRLRESEARLRHLFENAPVALWHEDFSAVRPVLTLLREQGVEDLDAYFRENPADLYKCLGLIKVEKVNQAALELHGATSQAELVARIGDTMTAEGIGVFREELVALAEGRTGTEAVTTVKTLQGERRHVMFRIFRDPERENWDSAYVAFMDLTAVREVEDLNARLITAIDQTGDSVVITDAEGTIIYCNPAFERVSGYRRDEVLGKNPRLLKSDRHNGAFYEEMWEAISAGRVWTGHLINRHKSGELFEEEGSISPIHDQDGNIINFVSVKRDVTRQMDLERRLNQSQKLEAVGQLAGGIAHDFNNILHTMLGHLDFAVDPSTDREDRDRELEMLRNSVERAGQLTRQLLAFSRRQVLELKIVDANDLVANLLKMVRRVIGEDISLDFRPGDIGHQMKVDPGQIEQVLLNLCLNARDAMSKGGRLLIETKLKQVDEAFVRAHLWAKCGPHIQITVSDSGDGIAPEVLGKIFEPFFTTKELGRGTGLGLATAYGTIKQHGGMILAESRVGKGSHFRILLPALTDVPVGVEPDKGTIGEPPGGHETILLAEDDQAVRNVVGRILERAGYRVIRADDGRQAVEMYKAHLGEIDLALLDLVMPNCSGPQAAEMIRAINPGVKILFNTGYSEDAIRGRIPAGLGAPLLIKPHDPRLLLTTVRELLDRQRG